MTPLHKISLIIAAAALLTGCGGGSDDAREQKLEDIAARHGIDADVTLDASGEIEKVVINQGGSQVGQGLDLPDGFPDDISLPGDWNVMAASAPMPNGYSIQALSKDDAPTIIEGLRSRLGADGWAETVADTPTPHMSRIAFEKDDRMANFNIIENGETRAVQLLTMPKP